MENQNEMKERKRSTSRERRARLLALKDAKEMGSPLLQLEDRKSSKKKFKRQSSVRSGYQLPSIYSVPKGARGRNEKPRAKQVIVTTPNSFDGATPQPSMTSSTMRSPTDPSLPAESTFSDGLNTEKLNITNGLKAPNVAEEAPSALRSVSDDDHSVSVSGNTYTSRVSDVSIHTADPILGSNDPFVTATNIAMGRHDSDIENISSRVCSGLSHSQADVSTNDSSMGVRQSDPEQQITTLKILDKLHEKDATSTFNDSKSMSKSTVRISVDEEQQSSPQMASFKQDQDEEKKHFSKKNWWIIALLALLVVIGVIVGVVLAVTGKGDNDVAQIDDSNPIDVRDMPNETISPISVVRDATASPQGAAPTTNAPVAATSSPVAATSTPVAATSTPVAATSTPVAATSASVTITSSPIATTSSPTLFTSSLNSELNPIASRLAAIIIRIRPQSEAALKDISTPQYRALLWLAEERVFQQWDDPTLLQRFALVTLYYATNGQEWSDSSGWLEFSQTECSWVNVECQDSSSVSLLSLEGLIGTLPDELALLTNLSYLFVTDSKGLVGPLPNGLFAADSFQLLQDLVIVGCNITGTIPTTLGNMPTLELIDLSDNDLTGTLPTELGQIVGLRVLEVNGNKLTGTIPSELGMLTKLTLLNLGDNQITGDVLTALENLAYIETLNLAVNLLTGTIPGEALLRIQTTIKYLSVGNNLFSGAIPTLLGSLTALTYLDVSANKLISSLPTEIGGMSLLTEVHFEGNKLTGKIPSEFGLLFNNGAPGVMTLNNNFLNGTIPSELGNMKGILELILDHNDLTGTLPGDLGNLPLLNVLRVASNKLSGPLPSNLASASSLGVLYIGFNAFTGTIPDEYVSLTELSDLRTEGNSLVDPIPSLCQDNQFVHFSVECPMTCECCKPCVSTKG